MLGQAGFLLAWLTHARKLYEPELWIQRIMSSGHELADKRAVLLVQLPPGMERDDARLGYFLDRLPECSEAPRWAIVAKKTGTPAAGGPAGCVPASKNPAAITSLPL